MNSRIQVEEVLKVEADAALKVATQKEELKKIAAKKQATFNGISSKIKQKLKTDIQKYKKTREMEDDKRVRYKVAQAMYFKPSLSLKEIISCWDDEWWTVTLPLHENIYNLSLKYEDKVKFYMPDETNYHLSVNGEWGCSRYVVSYHLLWFAVLGYSYKIHDISAFEKTLEFVKTGTKCLFNDREIYSPFIALIALGLSCRGNVDVFHFLIESIPSYQCLIKDIKKFFIELMKLSFKGAFMAESYEMLDYLIKKDPECVDLDFISSKLSSKSTSEKHRILIFLIDYGIINADQEKKILEHLHIKNLTLFEDHTEVYRKVTHDELNNLTRFIFQHRLYEYLGLWMLKDIRNIIHEYIYDAKADYTDKKFEGDLHFLMSMESTFLDSKDNQLILELEPFLLAKSTILEACEEFNTSQSRQFKEKMSETISLTEIVNLLKKEMRTILNSSMSDYYQFLKILNHSIREYIAPPVTAEILDKSIFDKNIKKLSEIAASREGFFKFSGKNNHAIEGLKRLLVSATTLNQKDLSEKLTAFSVHFTAQNDAQVMDVLQSLTKKLGLSKESLTYRKR